MTKKVRIEPGLAFFVVCDRGFAIGLYTHAHEQMGALVWMAEGFWDEEPNAEDVATVEAWRWCVHFPLAGAIRRHLACPIANVAIPLDLVDYPDMRASHGEGKWSLVRNGDAGQPPFERTEDRSLSIESLINDTMLREMLVSGWRPTDRW